jgi:hypothetical protein
MLSSRPIVLQPLINKATSYQCKDIVAIPEEEATDLAVKSNYYLSDGIISFIITSFKGRI